MANSSKVESDSKHVPKHVAIIMDGNGRWAQQRGKKRLAGHKAGVEAVRNSIKYSLEQGISALTIFAFSSENWQRPESEVSGLMDLFMYLLTREIKRFSKYNIKFKLIGDITGFSEKLQSKITEVEQLTSEHEALVLSVAANYGGRWDIANATQKIAVKVNQGEIDPSTINEVTVSEHMCLSELPELDLLIRTGGDFRISNFLLWQAAYTEFYFTELLWPDFNEAEFEQAVQVFSQRERRFGKTSEQANNN